LSMGGATPQAQQEISQEGRTCPVSGGAHFHPPCPSQWCPQAHPPPLLPAAPPNER
jgi:hypothetical protein